MVHSTAVTYTTSNGGGGFAFLYLIDIAIYILLIAGMWMTFVKAGEAGWLRRDSTRQVMVKLIR